MKYKHTHTAFVEALNKILAEVANSLDSRSIARININYSFKKESIPMNI